MSQSNWWTRSGGHQTPLAGSGRVVVISASIGAGHDGAARELGRRLSAAGHEVTFCDYLDVLPWSLGPKLRRAYAVELAIAPSSWGWLLAVLQRVRLLSSSIAWLAGRLAAPALLERLGPTPAAVVSTHHLASHAVGRLRRRGLLVAPAVTFLADLSVHRLWIAEGIDFHFALDSVAAVQACGQGARGVQVTSPAVGAAFRPAGGEGEKNREREKFGLPALQPLALVTAGSWGVGEIEEATRDIVASGLAQPVVVCGENAELRARLKETGLRFAFGWVEDMAALIRACDVVVQNAGGLTSLEALACGVPVVSYRCLPGHGHTNAAALDAAGLAVWIRTSAELPALLAEVLDGPRGSRQVTAGSALFDRVDPARAISLLANHRTGEVPVGVSPFGTTDVNAVAW
jgi:UDP-N-acetylglucosamine:LPS N-acetylglucosamine transferase